MEYFGILFEVFFLAVGLYVYLFSIGKLKSKDSAPQERAETFRKRHGWGLKIAALALMAIMTANLVLHILQLAQ